MSVATVTTSYCGRTLTFHLVGVDDPARAPDVVCAADPTFSPLLPPSPAGPDGALESQQQLCTLLDVWDGSTPAARDASLAELLRLLAAAFAAHQRARIVAGVHDERILFELSMLDALGCSEVLLAGDGDAQQAVFAIPVPVDLSPAQPLLACLQQQRRQAGGGPQQPAAGAAASAGAKQQPFVLHAAFGIGRGGGSHVPELSLDTPAWFSSQLPPLALPGWEPQSSLLEFTPHVAELLERHLAEHCPAAAQRLQLLAGLAELLGAPLEINPAPGGAGAGGSGSSASTSASGQAAAVFQVLLEQQPLLLFVELPPSYPRQPPLLRLQSVRRLGPDSCAPLQNLPWSPRWPVDEQVARIFNFLKQNAHTVQPPEPSAPAAAPAAAAAAAAGGGGPPAPGFYGF